MAISYSCDGCKQPVESPKKVGHVLQREYCEACAVKADLFITEEEKLRKETQATFVQSRNALIAFCSKDGFQLPDCP